MNEEKKNLRIVDISLNDSNFGFKNKI